MLFEYTSRAADVTHTLVATAGDSTQWLSSKVSVKQCQL